MNAQQEVEKLLAQIRALTTNPVIIRASDQLEVLCRGYMVPTDDFLPGVHFTRAESRMLGLMRSRMGKTISRDSLQDAAAFDKSEPSLPKTVDVLMCYIRAKLRACSAPYHIETDYGVGFRLCHGHGPVWAGRKTNPAKHRAQSAA